MPRFSGVWLFLLLLTAMAPDVDAAEVRRPNIVFIFADDKNEQLLIGDYKCRKMLELDVLPAHSPNHRQPRQLEVSSR